MDVSFGDYTIGTDASRLDIATIHRFLTSSYWARGHAELAGFRRSLLATRDAHAVYRLVSFTPLQSPERFMQPVPRQ